VSTEANEPSRETVMVVKSFIWRVFGSTRRSLAKAEGRKQKAEMSTSQTPLLLSAFRFLLFTTPPYPPPRPWPSSAGALPALAVGRCAGGLRGRVGRRAFCRRRRWASAFVVAG